jgi:hypothetical protein
VPEEFDGLLDGLPGDGQLTGLGAPGRDGFVGPDDRVRPYRLVQPDLGERVAGDEALAAGGVQRRPQRRADPVDGGRGDERSLPGALA